MDKRCPRKLKDYPDSWCPQAVIRLKAIRNAGRELTEEEEALLPGCPWAVDCRTANYCFHQYINQVLPEKPLSDIEIAGLLNISIDAARKLEKNAMSKLKQDLIMQELGSDLGS